MSDLSLNAQGVAFARNQRRLADFLRKFAPSAGVSGDAAISADNYVAPVLLKTDVLAKMCDVLHTQPLEPGFGVKANFEMFYDSVAPEQIERFQASVLALLAAGAKIDSGASYTIDFGSYEAFINEFTRLVEVLQQADGLFFVDFNAEEYVVNYAPSDSDIKIAINLLGTQIIAVVDNNKQLDKEPSVFGNNLWALYILCILGGFGLQITTKNIQYYAQYLGATALQTTNLTTYFNLVQLFSSVFWLWLSDIIGRQLVFASCMAIYAVACGLMNLAPKSEDAMQQIAIMQGLRAFTGLGAVLAPLAFVIVADLAPPKNRGIVTVLINVGTQIGSVCSSGVTVYLGSGKPYNTQNLVTGSTEYNIRNEKSYLDANYWSMGTFIVGTILCFTIFRESHPRIIALRKLKKMGIAPPKSTEVKATPIWRVFLQMCCNRDIVLLFFAYWINMIGSTNSRTGAQVFTSKMYGFTDTNYAKSYGNTAYIVSISLGILLTLLGTRWMIKQFGEIRVILFSQYTSIIESLINFAVDMPIPAWCMYITLCLTSITLVFCDAIFLQLVSMYTLPQNRGQVLGIFQLGNSIGRTLSGVLTGVMFDYNIRDAYLYNCLFAEVCIFLLAFVRPPLLRTEMDEMARKMKEESLAKNKI